MIAIIGVNSFSGSTFARFLMDAGIPVLGFARTDLVSASFTPHLNSVSNSSETIRVIKANLLFDYDSIAEEIERSNIKIVVNFAAQSMVAESWQNPEDWYDTNVSAFSRLISNIANKKKSRLEKFVHFTTPEVYGSTTGMTKENWNFHPTTPYAISRAASDFHLKAMFNNFGFPVIFTRAANVYGPHQRLYRLIPKLVVKAMKDEKFELHGGGNSIRSFVYSNDVAMALLRVVEAGVLGETYHISTNQTISIRNLVGKVLSKIGRDFDSHVNIVNERIGKDSAYLLDSEKIRSDLNWIEQTTLDEGIENVISWVQKDWEELRRLPLEYVHER